MTGWVIPTSCFATVVGTSTVEQPVNLGIKSDPARIPLGRVGVISNHNYGIHRMIGEARPAPDGAMRWEGGSELDQNLASVFGISVETEDETQISSFPVMLRVKPWKPPGYSPYTKEQVLAATLWCLLRRTVGTPENPLDIRIIAEAAEDKPLEVKYSGHYVNRPDKEGEVIPPITVAGTVLETDARGITWVVFPAVTRKAAAVPPVPGMIILEAGGDGDPGWLVLPVWGNGNDESEFLRLNNWSAVMCYSSYRSRGVMEANSFLMAGGSTDIEVKHSEAGDSVSFSYPNVPQETLAANILALVVSSQPTDAAPLTISIRVEESGLARFPAFRNAPGWKETRDDRVHSRSIELRCDFVWEAATGSLTKGSVPLVQLDQPGWIAPIPEPETSDDDGVKLASRVKDRIWNGIQDGTLLAEKIMPTDQLHGSGLLREIGKAGYHDALATYSNGKSLPDGPLDDPIQLLDDALDQAHHAGWVIGLARGEAIAIEVRKEIAEEKLKPEK